MTNGASGAVTRADRVRDGACVVVLACAAALYGYSYVGMRGIVIHPLDSTKVKMANAIAFDHLWNLSRIGRALFIAGLVALALSALVRARRRHT